jgi:hypothetical protein
MPVSLHPANLRRYGLALDHGQIRVGQPGSLVFQRPTPQRATRTVEQGLKHSLTVRDASCFNVRR